MKRLFLTVNGIVQGVGFRPFIHKLVQDYSLKGWVKNTATGVEIEVEGKEEILNKFIEDLQQKKPKLAVIESIDKQFYDKLNGYTDFKIIKSTSDSSRFTLISPDVAICEDCLKEMMDINDRRYRFPFINCTNCGPRFTIIKDVPYDREKTTMKSFEMCEDCEKEYKDIEDRRYHAQPDCCYKCGPSLFYKDSDGNILTQNVLEHVKKDLKEGKIVAIKGIGGFHLACDARNKNSVEKLRARKNREEKPFALMCKDIETVNLICEYNKFELEHLNSYRRPIVLLKKSTDEFEHISPDNNFLGIMLPYAPLHYLLFEDGIDVLVMTSANISDSPIIKDNEDAIRELNGIADTILFHNRDIHIRCDDSLLYVIDKSEYFIRRSRGYTPFPIKMCFSSKDILACGAEQKASFTLLKDNYAFLSQHIGDLKNIETLQHYREQIEHFENIFGIVPDKIVCDYHPDYLSTEYAKQRGFDEKKEVYLVQHHHAHMASCMADNDLNEKVIGITWDGTGLGLDDTLWGGEILLGDYKEFERVASIRPIRLAGGEVAIKEVYRIAIDILKQSVESIDLDFNNRNIIEKMLKEEINLYKTTSIGRLFDGVAALLDLKSVVSYEGQAAIILEKIAEDNIDVSYDYKIVEKELLEFNWIPMVKSIVEDIKNNIPNGIIAAKFMNTLVNYAVEVVDKISSKTGIKTVVLSGGVFQNIYLLTRLNCLLNQKGYNVFKHKRVSTNDEGLSLGQMAIVANGGGIKCV